jgi:2-iminobutanoate/2-iminopropanoate deaminase
MLIIFQHYEVKKMISSQEKVVVRTDKAPKAIGPYSAAIRFGNLVFTSGQIAIDPQTGNLVSGGIEAETRQVLSNIKNLLEAAGSGMDKVVRTTVFLRDMNDFGPMNQVYGESFTENPPARTTVQAAALPKGAALEIDTIAYVS